MTANSYEVQSFFWDYKMDLQFPFSAINYAVVDVTPRLHWHDFFEIGICTSGGGTFYFEGKSYEYTVGDVFLINNLEKHGAATFENETTTFRFFLFLPEFFLDGAGARDAEYLLPFRYDSASFCNRIDGDSEAGQRLKPLLEELWKEADGERSGRERLIRARLQLALAELSSLTKLDESPASAANLAEYLRLRPALLYIHANFPSRLNQKEVAALCYLSESRFRHLFKQQMGMSFQEYVAKLRYLEARRRIASENGSIADAVREAGFSNPYAFYQMFRENEGVTPRVWRSQLREELGDSRI
ncbi:MAG: helix-turn-helix domain-containing protein [Oscillospiraceae bacterium]|nr:helix-turn-helix domain-containing protein [Oscillospiraceae bacterium]